MIRNKTVIKDSDPWSDFAVFLGNMIAKYAEDIDFDGLPDPDNYLLKRSIREVYIKYVGIAKKARNTRFYLEKEIVIC